MLGENRAAAAKFEHLAPNEPVRFASEACLIVRRPGSQCSICRDICPAAALTGTEWSISIESDRCVGCGLCAAECPTGALQVDNCSPVSANPTGERILLECRRVAPVDRPPDATVISCLGGSTTVDLLDLVAETRKDVVLIDRGWCEQCAVAQCRSPWKSALNESQSLLGMIDPSLEKRLTVESRELPFHRAQPIVASLRPDKQVGRREFFKRFAASGGRPASPTESRRIVFGRGQVLPVKRRRILDHLRALAADRRQPLPSILMPSVKVAAEGCELNGVCAAICPTGALRLAAENEQISLCFDATNCIACGLCESSCANKALSFWPGGDSDEAQSERVSASRPMVVCAGCGNGFAEITSSHFCPACAKSMTIMQELSALKLQPPSACDADPIPATGGEED